MFDTSQPLHKNNYYLAAFTHERVAVNLQNYIAPEVAKLVQWDTLKVESGTFVDEFLRNRQTDILYSAKLNQRDAYVYVLMEHQSEEDWQMPIRMMIYLFRIWEQYFKQRPEAKKLPVIIPIVLYQGKTPWRSSLDFADFFELGGEAMTLARYIPRVQVELISILGLDDSGIQGNDYIQVVFRMMKAIRTGDMIECIGAVEAFLEHIQERFGDNAFIRLCFSYALHAPEVDITAVRDKFSRIQNPHLKATAMTAAQQLIQEGRQEGRQEGLANSVIDALEIRFDQELPSELAESIQAITDEARLRELHRMAIRCSTIEAFGKAL